MDILFGPSVLPSYGDVVILAIGTAMNVEFPMTEMYVTDATDK